VLRILSPLKIYRLCRAWTRDPWKTALDMSSLKFEVFWRLCIFSLL
jgi:hypothetical protein